MYPNGAVKQRAYRFRRRLEGLPPRAQLHARAAMIHRSLAAMAVDGHPTAKQLVGDDYQETALNLLVRFGVERVERARELSPEGLAPLSIS
jgi:hypothetical protein